MTHQEFKSNRSKHSLDALQIGKARLSFNFSIRGVLLFASNSKLKYECTVKAGFVLEVPPFMAAIEAGGESVGLVLV